MRPGNSVPARKIPHKHAVQYLLINSTWLSFQLLNESFLWPLSIILANEAICIKGFHSDHNLDGNATYLLAASNGISVNLSERKCIVVHNC